MLISVVICTRNRASLLDRLLSSFTDQTLPYERFEIIVVDNASSDNTSEVIRAHISKQRNLRSVWEGEVGLSIARNRGWLEAQGEYVGYLDDDARPPENWLEIAEGMISQDAPDILGGPYFAFYEQPKPVWFKDEYGSFHPGDQRMLLGREKGFLSGGNIFIKRSLLEELGGFRACLGMKGEMLRYGEETDFMLRVWKAYPTAKVIYEPRLYVFHLVRPVKWSMRHQVRIHFQRGRSQYLTFREELGPLKFRHVAGFLGLPVLIAIEATLGVVFRDRRCYKNAQNYLIEVVFRHIQLWGKLYERFFQWFGYRVEMI